MPPRTESDREFGRRLREARDVAGLSSEALAEKLHVSDRRVVDRWMSGERRPHRDVVIAWERLCGLEPGTLLNHYQRVPKRGAATADEAVDQPGAQEDFKGSAVGQSDETAVGQEAGVLPGGLREERRDSATEDRSDEILTGAAEAPQGGDEPAPPATEVADEVGERRPGSANGGDPPAPTGPSKEADPSAVLRLAGAWLMGMAVFVGCLALGVVGVNAIVSQSERSPGTPKTEQFADDLRTLAGRLDDVRIDARHDLATEGPRRRAAAAKRLASAYAAAHRASRALDPPPAVVSEHMRLDGALVRARDAYRALHRALAGGRRGFARARTGVGEAEAYLEAVVQILSSAEL